MIVQELIDNIAEVANLKHEGRPAEERLAFHVGMLEGKLREYFYLLENLRQEVHEIEKLLRD
jgi:hypothetical protein